MSEQYTLAGQGLKKVFIGQILCIFALIPIVGAILAVIGYVFHMLGLNTASKTHPGFKTAFTVAIASLVVAILSIFLPFLSVVTTILGLVECYYICTTSSEMLSSKGDATLAATGLSVWKMYMICIIVVVVCTILAFVPILGILAAIVLVIASIVLIVAGIRNIIFIYKAQESLQI